MNKMKKRVKRAKEWKKEQVEYLKGLVGSYNTVGIAKVRGIGANQLQQLRKGLHENTQMRVSKNRLISLSLKESGLEEMVNFVEDQMALIFTNLDAFELYKITEEGKIPAPIKAGAIAPHDIVLDEGPTSLKPGPIVGELQNLGIPAGITGGKIEIKKRTVAVKEGEKVAPAYADMLAKLEIYPMKEGLDLSVIYDREAQVLFTPDVLHVDPLKYFEDFKEGAKAAFSLVTRIKYDYPTRYTIADLLREAGDKSLALAVNIAYPTPLTIKPLLQKAHTDARNLAISACVYEHDTLPYLLTKARSQAQNLAAYQQK